MNIQFQFLAEPSHILIKFLKMTKIDESTSDHELKKLEKKLRNRVGKAIAEYNMIEESDVILAAISGGKL